MPWVDFDQALCKIFKLWVCNKYSVELLSKIAIKILKEILASYVGQKTKHRRKNTEQKGGASRNQNFCIILRKTYAFFSGRQKPRTFVNHSSK